MTEQIPTRLDSEADLLDFFDACDALEQDEEPDWEVQRAVIERSKSKGEVRVMSCRSPETFPRDA